MTPTVKLPLWVLEIERSGTPLTVVGLLDELFAVLVSPLVETVTVLVTPGTAAAATPTVSVMALLALTTRAPALVQLTVPESAEQLHPVPVSRVRLVNRQVGNSVDRRWIAGRPDPAAPDALHYFKFTQVLLTVERLMALMPESMRRIIPCLSTTKVVRRANPPDSSKTP